MNQFITDQELVKLAAHIIAANSLGQGFRPAEVTESLRLVHASLKELRNGQLPQPEQVNWQASIKKDTVSCLICGQEMQVLAPHLKRVHDLSIKEYRSRFHIPASISLVSLKVRAKRSQDAKDRNLSQYLKRR